MTWLRKIKRLINRLRGKVESQEELLEILKKAHAEKIITSYLYAFNEQIIRIANKTVEEVMVPRVDMVTLREDLPVSQAIAIYEKYGYSKMPVVKKRIDDVVGIFHIKELIKNIDRIDELKVKDLAIKPYFIPDSKKVLDALREFQRRRVSIAIVVDEFGSVVGLVTLEDLLEEIVGEIWEEFDREEVLAREAEDGSYIFNTKIELDEAKRYLGRDLEGKDVHTLGGFILERLDKVPQVGEKFIIDGVEFEVMEATQQRIKRVKARIVEEKKEEK
jgi:CBS domain containing-hemolysin-like protein